MTRGYIRQRGKHWEISVWDPARSKYFRTSVRGTREDAERKLTAELTRLDAGQILNNSELRVADYLERWLDNAVRPNLRPSTTRDYTMTVRNHLIPGLGHFKLRLLNPLDIQELYTKLDKEMSSTTVLKTHRILHRALKQAVRWRLVQENAAAAVAAPKRAHYEAQLITAENLQRILEESDRSPYGNAIYLAVTTGLRLGEVRGLRWQDCDFERKVISVRQSITHAGKNLSIAAPKSRKARVVAITDETVLRLAAQRMQQLQQRLRAGNRWEENDLVFPGEYGRPICEHALRGAFQAAQKAAGLPKARFHDLRHAHASMLLANGVHPKVVSERLGHSNINITMDLYSHLLPHLQAEAITDVDQQLKGA